MPFPITQKFRKPYLIRVIAARPRLLFAILFGLIIAVILSDTLAPQWVTRAIISWNAGAILYLSLAARMMFWSTHQKMHSRAKVEDEGQILILILVIFSVVATLASIFVDLKVVRDHQGFDLYKHMALAGISIATTWLFTHVMFALHYAHDYYLEIHKGKAGGLQFPGEEHPGYSDFLYFSFIIGTSSQTADVNLSSKRMRRTGLVHCILSFLFNTILLALTINIVSTLL